MKTNTLLKISALVAIGLLAATLWFNKRLPVVSAANRFVGPISSQPLALSADDALLAVANPDNNSVTFFDIRTASAVRLAEVRVGTEPNGVALSPDGTRAYVANTVSGTVPVLPLDPTNP